MVRVGLTGGIASGRAGWPTSLRHAVRSSSTPTSWPARWSSRHSGACRDHRPFWCPGTQRWANRRAQLAQIVFADPHARRDLERIVHPAVRARAAELERAAGDAAVVVHVIPLLVETGQHQDFDVVVTVDADHETQIQRLMVRNGFTRADAESRIAAQASREDRRRAADVVVDNTGSLTQLREQTDASGRTQLGCRPTMTYSQCSRSWTSGSSREACRCQVYSAGRFKEVKVGMPTMSG